MPSGTTESPRIETQTWGQVRVVGGHVLKDAKLWPGGCREWDWTETGTHHSPGIQVTDFQELIDHGADLLVLSRGVWKRLQVSQPALDYLEAHGIEHEILQTEEAVKRYNELAGERPVGALIHSTC